jgi:FAD/FMN-containing dehydrogenase
MRPIIVEAAETWPAVIAGLISGLGAAGIVAFVTLRVARKQRENDTAVAGRQRDAEADRTKRQLAHDRDMRDLQYLRETLAPIAEHAIGWEAFTSLHFLLDQAESRDFDEWKAAIKEPVKQVGEASERLRRDRRVLVVLLGPDAEVPKWLGELGDDGSALVNLARKRVEAGGTTPEIRAALNNLWTKFGFDQSRFIEHANKAVRIDSG